MGVLVLLLRTRGLSLVVLVVGKVKIEELGGVVLTSSCCGWVVSSGKRASAKSVIAAAMNYAANQQEPGKAVSGMGLQRHHMPQRPASATDRPPRGAPPGYGGGNSRANIISAFGQGDSGSWTGKRGYKGDDWE